MESNYEVCYTCDESGAQYPEPMVHGQCFTLMQARAEALQFTDAGQCGFVRRLEDGAVLAPDGTWILPEGA